MLRANVLFERQDIAQVYYIRESCYFVCAPWDSQTFALYRATKGLGKTIIHPSTQCVISWEGANVLMSLWLCSVVFLSLTLPGLRLCWWCSRWLSDGVWDLRCGVQKALTVEGLSLKEIAKKQHYYRQEVAVAEYRSWNRDWGRGLDPQKQSGSK